MGGMAGRVRPMGWCILIRRALGHDAMISPGARGGRSSLRKQTEEEAARDLRLLGQAGTRGMQSERASQHPRPRLLPTGAGTEP